MIAFITNTEYKAYSGAVDADLPADMARIILRAGEVVYNAMLMAYTVPATTAEIALAIKEATCAQVEYWLNEVGESIDAVQPRVGSEIGGVKIPALPVLAPRARKALWRAGYLNRDVLATGLEDSLTASTDGV